MREICIRRSTDLFALTGNNEERASLVYSPKIPSSGHTTIASVPSIHARLRLYTKRFADGSERRTPISFLSFHSQLSGVAPSTPSEHRKVFLYRRLAEGNSSCIDVMIEDVEEIIFDL